MTDKSIGITFILLLFMSIAALYITTANDLDIDEDPFYHEGRWIPDDSSVYDGDTISDILVKVYDIDVNDILAPYPKEEPFPGVWIEGDYIYVYTDIRIAGIDTPEKRPHKSGRTEESLAAEKAAAAKAQHALDTLLKRHKYRFEIVYITADKYHGRIVAEVFVGEDDERINVSEYMIEQGHAYAYDGKTKKSWDDGWYQQGE